MNNNILIIIFSTFIFIFCLFWFLYKIINLYIIYNQNKNNDFNKYFIKMKDDKIYSKIKYVRPKQIAIEGEIDINNLLEQIKLLEEEYNNLKNSQNNNENLSNKNEQLKKDNAILEEEIKKLNATLLEKTKELDNIIKSATKKVSYTKFYSDLYDDLLSEMN